MVATAAGAACITFPETGKQVCDRFLEYWQQNGGLAQQGHAQPDVREEGGEADDRQGEIAEGLNNPKRKGPYSDRVYPSGPEVGFIFQGGLQ